jgi:oligopeptide transport system substrate-binding protein
VENLEDKSVFRMNLDAGLESLDPAFAASRSPIWMTAQLYNGLLTQDSAFRAVPAIARRWEISPDGRRYTFHLRRDVYFHRHPCFGSDRTRRVVAQDFVYSFTRICDPALAAKGAWVFNGKIEGLSAFQAGEAPSISGLAAPDDSTLVIRLERPFPPFLGLLAMPYGYVVPREAVQFYGDDFARHPVGTGPFTCYRWEEGQHLILHRNPHYFENDAQGRPLPYLDAVSVRFIPSRLTAFVEFRQGNLDFIGDLDASYRDEVLTRGGAIRPAYAERYQFLLAPQLNTEYLGMLMDSTVDFVADHPLRDLRLRRALNYAIDREKLVRYLLNGMGYPAQGGFIPKGLPSHDPAAVPGFRYDPQKARELLAQAGHPHGQGLPQLTLHSTDKYAAISEFIQKSFENIGVDLDIQNLQGGALRGQVYGVKLNFWRASWIADYPDGENYLSLFYAENFSPDGPNTTHFQSAEFDRLYREALTLTDDSLRQARYHAMERLMLAQAPIIPLYYDRSFRMLQPGISGLGSNPMNHLYLKTVRKTPQERRQLSPRPAGR